MCAYLGQFAQMIGVQQQFLQAARIAQNVLRHAGQRAVPLVDKLHLPIAALEDRNALEHVV